jgi:hypothetical protein
MWMLDVVDRGMGNRPSFSDVVPQLRANLTTVTGGGRRVASTRFIRELQRMGQEPSGRRTSGVPRGRAAAARGRRPRAAR